MANTDVPQTADKQVAQTGDSKSPQLSGGDGKAGVMDVKNLDFILDIPMQITVQLGSARMYVRELLQLGQGSVVELDKLAGEPMEVLVNNKLVARGEVVVVNEKFGIRLTDVVSAAERVEKLR
jgi:flagellar motor switch protein FliN/FliY